jgi:hypothetical protein
MFPSNAHRSEARPPDGDADGHVEARVVARVDRRRGSRIVVTGGIVPPGHATRPNPNHPLTSLSPDQRAAAAAEALGKLLLSLIDAGRGRV